MWRRQRERAAVRTDERVGVPCQGCTFALRLVNAACAGIHMSDVPAFFDKTFYGKSGKCAWLHA